MSKESYIRGFCKAADAAGIDPVALAKYAAVDERIVASNAMAEAFSPLNNLFVGKIVGMAAGGIIARAMGKNVSEGVRHGKLAGMTIPAVGSLVGAISAAITRRRSRKEQAEYDKERKWLKNILIPGFGTYNHLKRMGSWKDTNSKKESK